MKFCYFVLLLLNISSVFAGRMQSENEKNRELNSVVNYQAPRSNEENSQLEKLLNQAVEKGKLLSENLPQVPVFASNECRVFDGFLSAHPITIDIALEAIKANFDEYQVIQLRSFKTNRLVIGCGLNNSTHNSRCPHDKAYLSSHGFDTWSVDPAFDPSVVAFWGDPENCRIFKDKKFDTIIDEGPVVNFVENKILYWQCARLALNDGGKILIPCHVLSEAEVPEDFEFVEIDKSHEFSYHDSSVFSYNKK